MEKRSCPTHLTVLGKGCKPLKLRGENRANREVLAAGREEVRLDSLERKPDVLQTALTWGPGELRSDQ